MVNVIKTDKPGIADVAVDLLHIMAAAVLFSLSFPNMLSVRGFFPIAWIALLPLFLLVRRIGPVRSVVYAPLIGLMTYALHNFWLLTFNPLAFMVVCLIYSGWFLFHVPCLKLADMAFPRYGWLIQGLFFLAYEALRTKGFLGYSYGILGYSQYLFRPLIGISDLGGVSLVSALVLFPSLFLSHLWHERRNPLNRRLLVPGAVWGVLVLSALVYGTVSRVDYTASPRWRPALIQHNVNAWMSGMPVYRKAFQSLCRLSDEALAESPDMIIWSETAFVPAVEWHNRYRFERDKAHLVAELLEYLEKRKDTPFLIGNNDAFRRNGERLDYNAALLFYGRSIKDRYHKNHLVPFTEHFPPGKFFPRIEQAILDTGVTFYEKGEERTVFHSGDLRFSVLICYEDTFGYLSRDFVRRGAEVLVNLTNDSWSDSPVCSRQHTVMAIFRAVENRRSMVRATNGGLTCVIDPNGRIIASLEPFTEDYLIGDVPVWTGRTTLYSRLGDWPDYLILPLSAFLLIWGAIRLIRKRKEV